MLSLNITLHLLLHMNEKSCKKLNQQKNRNVIVRRLLRFFCFQFLKFNSILFFFFQIRHREHEHLRQFRQNHFHREGNIHFPLTPLEINSVVKNDNTRQIDYFDGNISESNNEKQKTLHGNARRRLWKSNKYNKVTKRKQRMNKEKRKRKLRQRKGNKKLHRKINGRMKTIKNFKPKTEKHIHEPRFILPSKLIDKVTKNQFLRDESNESCDDLKIENNRLKFSIFESPTINFETARKGFLETERDKLIFHDIKKVNEDFSHLLLFSEGELPSTSAQVVLPTISSIKRNNNALIQIEQRSGLFFPHSTTEEPHNEYIKSEANSNLRKFDGSYAHQEKNEERGDNLQFKAIPIQSKSSVFDIFSMMENGYPAINLKPKRLTSNRLESNSNKFNIPIIGKLSNLPLNKNIQVAIQVLPYNDDPSVHLEPYDPPLTIPKDKKHTFQVENITSNRKFSKDNTPMTPRADNRTLESLKKHNFQLVDGEEASSQGLFHSAENERDGKNIFSSHSPNLHSNDNNRVDNDRSSDNLLQYDYYHYADNDGGGEYRIIQSYYLLTQRILILIYNLKLSLISTSPESNYINLFIFPIKLMDIRN